MKQRISGEELLTADDFEKAGQTIAEPRSEKKPRNGLIVALVAFNFAFLVVDVISAFVVGYLTRWYYGVATLLAGAVFMFIHEFLFTRQFNNSTQRKISVSGAAWAILTILFIAAASVFANLTGFGVAQYETYFLSGMVFVIVMNIIIHGSLMGVFYYVDDGHIARNKAARARARAITQNEIDDAADMILQEAVRRRIRRKELVNRYKSKNAIRNAIQEAGGDEDGDGIPDWMDPIDDRTGKPFDPQLVYSKDVPSVKDNHNSPTSRQ